MTCVSPVPTRYLVTTNKKCNNNTRTEITPLCIPHIYSIHTTCYKRRTKDGTYLTSYSSKSDPNSAEVPAAHAHAFSFITSSLLHIRHPARRVRRKPWRLPKRSRPPRTRCSHPDHVLSKLVVTFAPLDVIYRDSSNGPNTFASNVNVRSCTND